ncbi:MAG: tRNA-guanine transglycosylase [Longimicrobiales bacterium]
MFEFEIESRAGAARAGTLRLPHGVVRTPAFMPVGTQASVKTVSRDELLELGAEIVLANTYHLYLRPGHQLIHELGGLHGFMSWPRPVLTDSGGFQVFSLAETRQISEDGARFQSHIDGSFHLFTPENVIDVQRALGADVVMAFDECPPGKADRALATEAHERTLRWLERCRRRFAELEAEGAALRPPHPDPLPRAGERGLSPPPRPAPFAGEGGSAPERRPPPCAGGRGVASAQEPDRATPEGLARFGRAAEWESSPAQTLLPIAQGSTFADLRRDAVRRIRETGDWRGIAIGGLSVGEPKPVMFEMLDVIAPDLPDAWPRYVMGVGYPDDLLEAIRRGFDLFDCVAPTRNGRNGTAWVEEEGQVNLKAARFQRDERPIDSACDCYACTTYSRAYVRHLVVAGELLAQRLISVHNLRFLIRLAQRARERIESGSFDAWSEEWIRRYQNGHRI